MRSNERKERVELWMAVFLCGFGCVLLVAGFIVDPTGVIDNSVLIAFGEISTLIGAILGVDYHKEKVINGVKNELINKS